MTDTKTEKSIKKASLWLKLWKCIGCTFDYFGAVILCSAPAVVFYYLWGVNSVWFTIAAVFATIVAVMVIVSLRVEISKIIHGGHSRKALKND